MDQPSIGPIFTDEQMKALSQAIANFNEAARRDLLPIVEATTKALGDIQPKLEAAAVTIEAFEDDIS